MRATPSTVHALVHGQANPRLATIERIAKALDMTVAEVLDAR